MIQILNSPVSFNPHMNPVIKNTALVMPLGITITNLIKINPPNPISNMVRFSKVSPNNKYPTIPQIHMNEPKER